MYTPPVASHSGKRLFFPLLSIDWSIYPGEGNIWMSLVTKLSSKPVLTHWNQLCNSGLKTEEEGPVLTWTGSWKMYLWPSLLHSLSCKLSRTKYMLHLRAANNSSSNSCWYRSSGFFPLQIFCLQWRHPIGSRDSVPANCWPYACCWPALSIHGESFCWGTRSQAALALCRSHVGRIFGGEGQGLM